MPPGKIVTLLTDFGAGDHYVAQMKGAILSICPQAHFVDISHQVEPFNILKGAFMLGQVVKYFPAGTVHLAVIDPGVGTDRRLLAAKLGGQIFLAPDNGLLSLAAASGPLEQLVAIRNPRFLPPLGTPATFQGRDVLAPVAAHILNGLDLAQLGPQPDTFKVLDLPSPTGGEDSVKGQVLYVDHFGNLVSNIPAAMLASLPGGLENVTVSCNARNIGPLVGTYGFVQQGQLLALINSMGLLEVAANCDSAAKLLNASTGTEIHVSFNSSKKLT